MLKPKLQQNKNSLQIVHSLSGRLRLKIKELDKNSDDAKIEADIGNLSSVRFVRVNKYAKSIIVEFDGDKKSIVDYIENMELPKKVDNDKVSKSGIYKALAATAITPLIPSNFGKTALSLYAASSNLKEGASDLVNDGITSKALESMAIGVSLLRQDYLAANSTNLMLNLGEYMEETSVARSDELIKELAKPSIEEVWVESTDGDKKVLNKINTKDVCEGDIVVVGAGETIGVDGYIVHGNASINQVSMTGEAEPVAKARGDRVISGTVVEEGSIKIWAEAVGSETATERIKEYIQASLNEKSAIGLKASKLADSLVPVTLGLAGASYLFKRDMQSVASVLQADYSCALKLATPVAFKSSISKAGRNGILIKGAKAIEALATADTFVFDKTGTLTSGKLSVVKVCSFKSELSESELLNLTASAEEHYFHPVAEAIVDAANKAGFKHIHHDEVEFIVAHGIKTQMNGKEVIIGSRHFLEDDKHISFKKHDDTIEEALKDGLTLLYIGYGGELVGMIGMKDSMRSNAKQTLQKLKSLGVKELIMITGDIKQKAYEVANFLGIDKVYAECLPTDKAKIIQELKDQGKNVAFVGDGINDAPSLSKANVGISMHKGADIAKATADISLLKDDISSVAAVKELSVRTMDLINSNFKSTVGINSAILGAATIGILNPIATAILHNGTTIWLLLNSIKGVKIDK